MHDRVFQLLGLFMLIRLPTVFKIGRLTAQLRREHLQTTSPDSQTMPPLTAMEIARRVKQSFRARMGNKAAAQLTLNVYENLNAQARLACDNWTRAVHVLSFLLAITFALALAVRTYPSLARLALAGANRPTRVAMVNEVASADGPAAVTAPATSPTSRGARLARPNLPNDLTVLANFPGAARAAFDDCA